MRRAFVPTLALLTATLCAPCLAADDAPPPSPQLNCSNGIPGGVNCVTSKKDLKAAREAYSRGLKFQQDNRLPDALEQFDRASRLAPQDPNYLTSREAVKAQMVFGHIEAGNESLDNQDQTKAAAQFRAALSLDPDNSFARERLAEATRDTTPGLKHAVPSLFEDSGEIRLEPREERATFHFRGDVRALFTELSSAFGMTPEFDDSVVARQVRFNVDDVDFQTALRLACQVSKTMWTPLSSRQFFLASDTPENHKQYDRMSLRTFILPPHSTPQEATDVVTTLRTIFDMRFVSLGQTANTMEVRAPQKQLEAVTKLMAQLTGDKPQVILDVRVFQIDHQLTKNIGIHTPDTFNLFNIPVSALAALGGTNIQDLINQLISSGGINQAGGTSLSALLAQLTGQQNNIFSQPLATFGGGLTFMGLSLDKLVFSLSLNESWSRSLEHLTLRAAQGNEANFHLGTRFPILNASYAPIFNSPQISQVLGNQSYVPPFPSVSYEDLGLNVKVKPAVHGNGDGDVSLQLEMQVRSLTGQSANGVPVISNKEYKGSINLRDGEPAVIAGQISDSDQRSMTGIPGFGAFPLLNKAMVNNTSDKDQNEMLVVITPHVVSNFDRSTEQIWISEK